MYQLESKSNQINANSNQCNEQKINNKSKASTKQNTIEMKGDSILKEIERFKMSEASGERVFIKSFSGATTDCMNSHAVPAIKRNPKAVILHCGANDVRSNMTPDNIAEEIIDLAKEIRSKEKNVYVSGLVQPRGLWNEKVMETNR